MKASIKILKRRLDGQHKQESNESKTSEAKKSAERSTSEMVSTVKSWIVELQQRKRSQSIPSHISLSSVLSPPFGVKAAADRKIRSDRRSGASTQRSNSRA